MTRPRRSMLAFALGLLLGILLAAALSLAGDTVSTRCVFAWDPNPEADLAGYRLYVRPATGTYPTTPAADITAPTTSVSCAAAGLVQSGDYAAVLTAYDAIGNESAPSLEVAFTVDASSPGVPTGVRITISTTVTVTVP